MKISKKSNDVIAYFNEILKDARCELNYTRDYELVIAVMLSAQTTDKAVNNVTKDLFRKYPSLDALNSASLEDIENIIKPIGLYKNKAINLKGIVKTLIEKFNYNVPKEKNDLLTLPESKPSVIFSIAARVIL